ncbi:MAG TPA: aspartate/glutamate racemase family protein [Alphaproteobacteria bacterium]
MTAAGGSPGTEPANAWSLSHPYGWRARLGLIVPPTNTVNEAEWRIMAPEGVTIHSARMPLHTETDSDAGKAVLYDDLRRAAADLAQAGVDVVAYGCTAGSMVLPLSGLTDFMTSVAGVPAVATAAALVGALRALGVRRIALATPYHDPLTDHERDFFARCQIDTVTARGLGFGANGPEDYRNIARLPAAVAYRLAKSVDRPEAEAIVISCTDFATLRVIPVLESELGKPVISSNQATFWAALRAAGVSDRPESFGRLLREH